MRKYFLFFMILLCISFTGCANDKTIDKLVKDNQQTFFSDNADWNLTFKKEVSENSEIISNEKNEYTVKFIRGINKKKNQSEVEIIEFNTNNIIYTGDFDGFISFLVDIQKAFYSESAIHKLKKNNKDKKIKVKGSPYAKREYKKNVYDEITTSQTVSIKDGKQITTTTIFIELEKQYQ